MSSSKAREIVKILQKKEITDEEKDFLYKNIKKILTKAIRNIPNPAVYQTLIKIYGENYLEDLAQEYLLKLCKRSSYLQALEVLNESYLIKMATNLIYFLLAKERVQVLSEEISTQSPSNSDSEDTVLYLDKIVNVSYVNDYFKDFIIEGVLKTLKSNLTGKEWEALCFYLMEYTRGTHTLSRKDKNAIYKRWERLKPKLRSLLLPYMDIDQDFCTYWEEIAEKIKSEICSSLD